MNHSVVVIDDEQDCLDCIGTCLREAGIEQIRLVNDPKAAFDLIDAGEMFDIAFIDAVMPQIDGQVVLNYIRKKRPRAACVMVSSIPDVKYAVECMKLGVAEYIQKPFTSDEFLSMVKPILSSLTPRLPEKLKLLVVEDDRISLKKYEQQLSDRIFDIQYAVNGELAENVYREWKPDIILLDLMLPKKSGYALLKEIREADSSTAVIVVSGLDSKEDILNCADMGIQGYMVKPVNWKQLNVKILDYFGKKNGEKAKVAAVFRKRLKDPESAGP